MIQLNFPFFNQIWESEIIENGSEKQRIWFVDKGTKLPFFISNWQHHHLIKQDENDVIIIDSIQLNHEGEPQYIKCSFSIFIIFLYSDFTNIKKLIRG